MQEDITIFDLMYDKYKIDKPIRLIELFGGYGSQALALKYLGVEFEHWKLCEWAVKSIQAYKDINFEKDNNDYSESFDIDYIKEFLYTKGISKNYNEPMTKEQISKMSEKNARQVFNNIFATHNLVNISTTNAKDLEIKETNKYCYIMTYSFPCQDLSLAGKGKGMKDTSTRSGLIWEVERILSELDNKPQILLMENVPQVHSQDNIEDFHKWQLRLEQLGYKNYMKDLIATDYGIPQTRNRCFMVSILGNYSYTFPKPTPLKLKLKDMLEDEVDEKYYLSDKMIEYISATGTANFKNPDSKINLDVARPLTTDQNKRAGTTNYLSDDLPSNYNLNEVVRKYGVFDKENQKHQAGSVYDENGLSPTLDTMQGGWRQPCIEIKQVGQLWGTEKERNPQDGRIYDSFGLTPTLDTKHTPKIIIKNATKKGYLEAKEGDGIDISSRMDHHRGNVQKDKIQTITTSGGNDRGVCIQDKGNYYQWFKKGYQEHDTRGSTKVAMNNLRIRKLTPKECFRLMGVKDEDFDKVKINQSDSSLYHLAGDSIVVNVLMAIFKQLL